MLPARALLEVPGLLLGPVVCRITGRHRPYSFRHHAAPAFRICLRCSRTLR
ncbi:hypothetical protein [Nocardioides nitrophenolicus]|uniref:hypothetical protein n=1 Tax=Nocardioides nitrophenolicus TaxID=60489 RepID=UPI00195D463E|nr:hypothetical protein [Nocardioides nitrophenolicus]MBM7518262.1 hypothetical protein [Nocardioides nitrophenolicus]